MAIREILREDDPVLRKVCHKVEKFDRRLWAILDDMAETMYEANGVGLAGPQIGIVRRIVVIDVGNGRIELMNPEIVRTCGNVEGPEGCLSSPGEYGIVPRPEKVRVRAQDRNGDWFEMTGEGLLARAFCHEIDHLDGKLFKDLAIRMMDPEELED